MQFLSVPQRLARAATTATVFAALPLAAATLGQADGDLLAETNLSVWMRRDDMSLNQWYRAGSRYEELTQFVLRLGHYKEWENLVKLVLEGYKKGLSDAHWGAY